MPLYDVEHVTPLTDRVQEELAKSITRIHAERFKTPSYFVDVRYFDASSQNVFRGGVLRRYNRIILRCRAGETRSVALYNEHCGAITKAWEQIVGKAPESELRAVWIQASLTTALESGFFRPQAGEEVKWLQKHKSDFQDLAEAGDEDMKGLMVELRTRPEFAEVVNSIKES